MPRKKESSTAPLPGFDIFDQPMSEADRGVLLKPQYRRKALAGFVPLWNEFFRCYHRAGVSPQAVYLWAYLRQYEHERREWNAVSDISWPGRRDIADALGVSISHLPNLLAELRRAGLVTYQPVLPGFEDLADALDSSVEEVRDRAAEYGVSPKVDGTLYRTADPFTKTEFAAFTGTKFCRGCKAYRYCEGVKEAQARLSEGKATGAKLPAPVAERKLAFADGGEGGRTAVNTVAVTKKDRSVLRARIEERIEVETVAVAKKDRSVNPSKIKTNSLKPTVFNQPEKANHEIGGLKRQAGATPHDLVVAFVGENNVTYPKGNREAAKAEPSAWKEPSTQAMPLPSQTETGPELQSLLDFGFDHQTAARLLEVAASQGKAEGYVERILRYCRENARQSPQGMARRLIERGEERLGRADRYLWHQQNMFGGAEPVLEPEGDFEEPLNSAEPPVLTTAEPDNQPVSDLSQRKGFEVDAAIDSVQATLATAYRLGQADLVWWNGVLARLNTASPTATDLFRRSVGLQSGDGRLVVVMRNLFDRRRAEAYAVQLERAVASVTGKLPQLEFTSM